MLPKKISARHGVFLLFASTMLVYGQVLGHDFISLDDGVYIVENPYVRSGLTWPGVWWSLTQFYDSNWFPLTWLSHMADYQLFGLNPGLHHLMNVLFHFANTCLLFLWIRKMTGESWKALSVAMLFALHPLHVESVAWASERKDVLSGFFWMLALLAYAGYARKPGPFRYGAVLLAYFAGILSKPMVVTLPFVMLLLDFWPLGRMNFQNAVRLIKEKIPFFILSFIASVVAYLAQAGGGSVLKIIPLGLRIQNAVLGYGRYLKKTILPFDLGIFYPYDADKIPAGIFLFYLALIAGVSLFAVLRIKKQPWFFSGWFWFLGTLVPVIGLVQIGGQAMADRYTYLPLIGIFIIFAWGGEEILKKIRMPAVFALAGVMLFFSALCAKQISYWKNSLMLYEHTISVTKDNYSAHQNISGVYAAQGDYEKAEFHLKEALRISNNDPDALNNLANVFRRQGRFEEALRLYDEILQREPRHPEALINTGDLFFDTGNLAEAASRFETVMRAAPKDKRGFKGAAKVAMKKGEWERAGGLLREVLQLDPNDRDANLMLGNMAMRSEDWKSAESYYRKAAEWHGDDPEILNNLANTLTILGKFQEAFSVFKQALEIKPEDPKLNLNYGLALARAGETAQATYYYKAALKYDPSNQKALEKLNEIEKAYI